MYPRSNCMPSTTSSSLPRLFASSTVITPSLPTFCIASAIMRPISGSPLAEMVPTCAISSLEVTFLAFAFNSLTTAVTALSTPRFKSIGLPPAATDFAPSFTIAWASNVAVMVPSPAVSEVLDATSRTICAPIFSNLSSSSISLATVTPSLVTRGAPNDLSSTTLRPLGPSVTLTALLRMSTPRSMRSRASTPNLTSLADIFDFPELNLVSHPSSGASQALLRVSVCGDGLGSLLLGSGNVVEDAHDVAFLHDQQLLAVELDLGAGPLAEQHAVANLEVDRDQLAGRVAATRADGGDFALRGLFLGTVRNDDAASGLLFGVDALDHDAVVKRTEFHAVHLSFCRCCRILEFWQSVPASASTAAEDIGQTCSGDKGF